jgi:hypothetical protein
MMPDFQSKRLLSLLAISISLTACEPNEMYPAGGIPFSGSNSGGGSAPAQQAAPAQRLAPMPMIDNPDEPYEEWEVDQVWGDSQAKAEQLCRQIAENQQVKFVRVERVSSNSKRWRCIISNK